MSGPLTHILHLTEETLNWATVASERGGLRLFDHGSIDAPAPESLDRWIEREGEPEGNVVLYDGRPMYFSFMTDLPGKARKQRDNIVRLKVRQELGLSDDLVYWAARPRKMGATRERLELFTVVVRREAMKDILDWRERHAISGLWVGADVCAIEALFDRGVVPSPSLVVNNGARGATLYHSESGRQILKSRVAAGGAGNGAAATEAPWPASIPRMRFGRADLTQVFEARPELSRLPEGPALDFQGDGRDTRRLLSLAAEARDLDAVVLGGLADLHARRPAMQSLIPFDDEPASQVALVEAIADRLQVRMLLPMLALGAILCLVSIASVFAVGRSRTGDVIDQAQTIQGELARLRVQSTLLGRIEADKRRPMIPIMTAIHEAAPGGVQLETLNINKDGKVTMSGKTNSEEVFNEFLHAMRELEGDIFVRESVQTPGTSKTEVKREGQNSRQRIYEYKFPVEAQLIGWGR